MGVNQLSFVEWLCLVVAVSILCSNNVGVLVCLRLPACLIKQLRVRLVSACNGARSIARLHLLVKSAFVNCELDMGVRFSSLLGLEICLSESGAPILIVAGMRLEHCCLSIATEEIGPGRVKSFLVLKKSVGLPSGVSFLKLVLLHKAPAGNLGGGSSELGVAIGSGNETCVVWDDVRLHTLW